MIDMFLDFVSWLELLVNEVGIICVVMENFKCMV